MLYLSGCNVQETSTTEEVPADTDNSGNVTLDQVRAVEHADTVDHDDTNASITDELITLTKTVTVVDSSEKIIGTAKLLTEGSSVTNVYNTYVNGGENYEVDTDKASGGAGITGGVIGAGLLSGWQIVVVIVVIGLLLVAFIVSRTILQKLFHAHHKKRLIN